jgi:hypothetical protein
MVGKMRYMHLSGLKEKNGKRKKTLLFVQVASELLAAAEKYQMDELKDLCEEQLIASTDTGNALAHFFLANRFKGQCHMIVFP